LQGTKKGKAICGGDIAGRTAVTGPLSFNWEAVRGCRGGTRGENRVEKVVKRGGLVPEALN